MSNNLTIPFSFHHLGFACKDIDVEKNKFLMMGYSQEGCFFEDAHQGVKGCFLVSGNGSGSPRIELLENLPGSTRLNPWLDNGSPLYHMAYVVEDIDLAIEWARNNKGKVVSAPYPAVAFDMKSVCFVVFRGGFMIEFIEA